jgi:radical SAM superfamily enzyme YgiQ (UPF0313 family)
LKVKLHLISPTKKGETYLFNKGLLAPLGLMYLAACTPEEVEIRLIDENTERLDFTEVPDLVGITTMTATAPRAYEIASRYREMGSKVVLGGVHASMLPEEALQYADTVVIGEAEGTWPQVVADAQAGRLQPIYKQEEFLDFSRPIKPRRDLIDPKRYWCANSVQVSRGCPHACNFCSVTAFNGHKVRMRDVDSVLEEVETLTRGNLSRRRIVAFVDDNIAGRPAQAKELFRALIPHKIRWGSQASIDMARDEELVALAAESGCQFLFIGLETTSAAALKEMGKRQNKAEQYEEGLRLLRKYGIQVMGAFVFGFDSDDETVFADTLDFAMRNKIQVAQFAALVPYPGTRLYKQTVEEERVEPGYWFDESWDSRVVFQPKKMSAQRLDQETHAVSRRFYSYPSIFKRMYPHRGVSYWFAFNLLYRHTIVGDRSHAVGEASRKKATATPDVVSS